MRRALIAVALLAAVACEPVLSDPAPAPTTTITVDLGSFGDIFENLPLDQQLLLCDAHIQHGTLPVAHLFDRFTSTPVDQRAAIIGDVCFTHETSPEESPVGE